MVELTGANLKFKYRVPSSQRGKSYRARERTSKSVSKTKLDNATMRLVKEEKEIQRKQMAGTSVTLALGPDMKRHWIR